MIIGDLKKIAGRNYPARRLTQNLVDGWTCLNFRSLSAFVLLD